MVFGFSWEKGEIETAPRLRQTEIGEGIRKEEAKKESA